MKKLVILESPYAGGFIQRWLNRRYARKCVKDSLMRGEYPIASHLLYTQPGVLNDKIPDERAMGINAGLAWRFKSQGSVVYTDRGITGGMRHGIAAAHAAGRDVEYRALNPNAEGRQDVGVSYPRG